MESISGSAFSRLPDRNGTIVSACNTCLAAVAVSRRETELENAESNHACDPENFQRWKTFLNEIKRRNRNETSGRKRGEACQQRGDAEPLN